MLIHRGEAWLDGRQTGIADAPSLGANVASGLGSNLHFNTKAETRPEEILATAHAASYCLSLWKRLQQAGHPAKRIHTVAYIHQNSKPRHRGESEIFLNAIADIPGLPEEAFVAHARAAKADFVNLRGLADVPVRLEPHLHA
jgi:organic hydroperoxide reductase OsmC/OhrA